MVMLYSKRRKNLGGGRTKRSNRKLNRTKRGRVMRGGMSDMGKMLLAIFPGHNELETIVVSNISRNITDLIKKKSDEKQEGKQECSYTSCSQDIIVSYVLGTLKNTNRALYDKMQASNEMPEFNVDEKVKVLQAISPNYKYDPKTQRNDTDIIRIFNQSVQDVKDTNDTSIWWNNIDTFKEKPYKDYINQLDLEPQ